MRYPHAPCVVICREFRQKLLTFLGVNDTIFWVKKDKPAIKIVEFLSLGRGPLTYFARIDSDARRKKMRKLVKKLLCTTLAVGVVLGGVACKKPVEEKPEVTNTPVATQEPEKPTIKTIGICQYADHYALNESREGILEALKNAGLVEGTDFKVDYQNAGLDSAKCETIAKDFVTKDVDVICSIATNAATACMSAAEGKDIPVIYAAVTDPEGANLTGENVIGTSDELRIDAQLKMIRELQPRATAIGIVYFTNEPNASYAIGEYSLLGLEHGFVIRTIGVSSVDEVSRAVDTLISLGVDCFCTVSDNGTASVLASVLRLPICSVSGLR